VSIAALTWTRCCTPVSAVWRHEYLQPCPSLCGMRIAASDIVQVDLASSVQRCFAPILTRVQCSGLSSAVCIFAACRPQLQHVALQPLAQQPAATPGTGPPARMLQCRLDAHAAALQVSSRPAAAAQQHLVSCGSAVAAWLSAGVGLAVAPAAGAGAVATGGTHTCFSTKWLVCPFRWAGAPALALMVAC
jgi:hypothetical protein